MTWKCESCTYTNQDSDEKCTMCTAAKPSAEGSAAGTPASRRSVEKRIESLEVEVGGGASGGGASGARPTRLAPPRVRPGRGGGGCGCDMSEVPDNVIYLGACCCAMILFISCFLIGYSFRIVDWDEYGLLRAELSGAIVDNAVYDTGRHFVGLGFVFVTLKKNMRTVSFAASGGTSQAISIRTIDGKIIEIEATFQYVLDESRIYDIYAEYGESVEDFFVTMARARLRDVASRHSSSEFFADRRRIEVAMSDELGESLSTRMAVILEFQLGRVGLPFTLENFLKSTQLKRIQLLEEIENLIVDEIQANTTVELIQKQAGKNLNLTIIEQTAENTRLGIDLTKTNITQTTALLVGKIEADSAKTVTVYNQETEVLRLHLVTNTTRVEGATAVAEAEIQQQVEKARADKNRELVRIAARADAQSSRAAARAAAQSIKLKAAALSDAYANLRSELGFNASHINALMWKDVIAAHGGDRLFMDTQKPGVLDLDGQQEILFEQLDDTE